MNSLGKAELTASVHNIDILRDFFKIRNTGLQFRSLEHGWADKKTR